MIGVVVWSDAARKKAVIWCEDQRDLAYCLLPEGAVGQLSMSKGDLVEFESRYEGTLRIAENVFVVESNCRSALADALRASDNAARRDDRTSRGRDHHATPEATGPAQAEVQDNSFQGAEITTLSIPDRPRNDRSVTGASDTGIRSSGGRNGIIPTGERTSAKILRFPELMRA